MSKHHTNILIVEDEPGIAELLRFTLDAAGFSCDIVVNANEARAAIGAILPQLVLLDWMLPDTSGLALLQEWRAHSRTATLPVIMLTAKGMDEDKVRGLNDGADDYITKPFSPMELVARIQALLRRKVPELGHSVLKYGTISIDTDRYQVSVENQAIALDQAEFKLLRFLIAHPERIFSRAQLLDKVWGDHTFIEERTVDVHIMRLRKSLGLAADYVKTIRGVGYKITSHSTS
ncbi:winged helix-turn-helix domain-containing protein [Glaciimonas immobilis]|uniref:Two-component system phosphate regulon response regulator PhoB n=1 Tax=Glaciimonas immobilis TaxID=728004 RepID=A0A840RKU6_9BURK|nr:response regulator [Glaciimonas immobilis]KAF3999375.1 response regulator [Glaciimonas immobilis]MBB5198867.1 two-component system phosphate regulon response regulator PhoB [Glaciimonas immobilis]